MIFAFDFHGVTLPWAENNKDIDSDRFAKMIVARTGKPLEEVKYYLYGELYGEYKDVTEDYKHFVEGRLSSLEFLTRVLTELYSEHFLEQEEFVNVEAQANELLEEYLSRIRINWAVLAVVKQLTELGHNVGYLTNRTGLSMKLLEEMDSDYIKYFPLGGVSSHEFSFEKPDIRIYEAFLGRVQEKLCREICPDEVVLVDDRDINARVAEQMGWKSIIFKDENQLVEELKQNFNIMVKPVTVGI